MQMTYQFGTILEVVCDADFQSSDSEMNIECQNNENGPEWTNQVTCTAEETSDSQGEDILSYTHF